jgi:hypothetical protein
MMGHNPGDPTKNSLKAFKASLSMSHFGTYTIGGLVCKSKKAWTQDFHVGGSGYKASPRTRTV